MVCSHDVACTTSPDPHHHALSRVLLSLAHQIACHGINPLSCQYELCLEGACRCVCDVISLYMVVFRLIQRSYFTPGPVRVWMVTVCRNAANGISRPSVGRLSVTLLSFTQRVELFGNIFAPSNSLGARTVCIKILGRNLRSSR